MLLSHNDNYVKAISRSWVSMALKLWQYSSTPAYKINQGFSSIFFIALTLYLKWQTENPETNVYVSAETHIGSFFAY